MNLEQVIKSIQIPKDTCEYWDARLESTSSSEIQYKDFELASCQKKPSVGAFLRVYEKGLWFYTSTTDLDTLSHQVVTLSRKAKKYMEKRTPPTVPFHTLLKPYNTKASKNRLIQFEETRMDRLPLTPKRHLCEGYFETLKSFPKLKGVKVAYRDDYKVKCFISSTGVQYAFDFNQCGLMIGYSVVDEYAPFNDFLNFYGKSLDSLKNLEPKICEYVKESHCFTRAKPINPGTYPVLLDSAAAGIFAHESFGHKSEADFMDENTQKTWKIGKKVGNKCLSIVDHGGERGTSGYCPFDDEGFPTQKTYLIKKGILTGRLHSQQTSRILNEDPTGNGRAINFEFEPIVRMTNTYIEPGEKTLKEIISKVDLGIYAKDYRHGSGLSTFTIAPRKCYMIRQGKIAEPVRVSVLSGSVFETLGKIEDCTKGFRLESYAFGGCGKMDQPGLPVGFGGPEVLVSQMMVS